MATSTWEGMGIQFYLTDGADFFLDGLFELLSHGKKELFYFLLFLMLFTHLVAGIHGAEDAEGAPALAVPVRVGPAGGVALLEVHYLAVLAADPGVLA